VKKVSGVEGPQNVQPPSPDEVTQYKQEYDKSFKLFQKAFEDYNQKNVEIHKKEKLEDVMRRSLNIMNETAQVALNAAKQAQEAKLAKDTEIFLNNPSAATQQKVSSDIEELK